MESTKESSAQSLHGNIRGTDIALLIIRIALAIVFIAHGLNKFESMDGAIAFFTAIGAPAFLAYVAATVELFGGLFMLFGVLTGWSGVLLALDMLGAMAVVHVSTDGGLTLELEVVLFLVALAITLAGPGHYTIKQVFAKKQ